MNTAVGDTMSSFSLLQQTTDDGAFGLISTLQLSIEAHHNHRGV
jgi:hypothetical protein